MRFWTVKVRIAGMLFSVVALVIFLPVFCFRVK